MEQWKEWSFERCDVFYVARIAPLINGGNGMKAIKKALTIVGIMLLSVMMLIALVGCDSEEVKSAKESFNGEVTRIQASYNDLQAEISTAQELAATDEIPLDDSLKPALEDAISNAKTIKFEKPAMPSGMDEIIAAAEGLKDEGYDDEAQVLRDAETALSNSIEQRKLVMAPSEAFIVERLQGVDGVGEVATITEETDQNRLLGKQGTYYARIVFASPLVDQSGVFGSSLAERGTDAGGSIEVFETEEAAKKRCDYIATYDGSALRVGTHTVIGTVLVRTSDELTASQQKQLEANIITALTRL